MFQVICYIKNKYLDKKAQGIVEYAILLAFVSIVAYVLINPAMGVDDQGRPSLQWFSLKVRNVIFAVVKLLNKAL